MKLTAFTSVFFSIFGLITTIFFYNTRNHYIASNEGFYLFGMLWLSIAIVILGSFPMKSWLDTRRTNEAQRRKVTITAFGAMTMGTLCLVGALITYATTAPSFDRSMTLASMGDINAARSNWCHALGEKQGKRYHEMYQFKCLDQHASNQKKAGVIKKHPKAATSYKAIALATLKKTTTSRFITIKTWNQLDIINLLPPDKTFNTEVNTILDAVAQKDSKLRKPALKYWSEQKPTPPQLAKHLVAFEKQFVDEKLSVMRHFTSKKNLSDKTTVITRLDREFSQNTQSKVILQRRGTYDGLAAASHVIKKTIIELPPLLRQRTQYTHQALTHQGYKTLKVHKHLTAVLDKTNQPIFMLRERGGQYAGAITLAPPQKANAWTSETTEAWASMLTKEMVTPSTPSMDDATLNTSTDQKKPITPKTKPTDPSTPTPTATSPHKKRGTYRVDSDFAGTDTPKRTSLGRMPVELRHLSISWMANHAAAEAQFDTWVKAKLAKQGYKGKQLDRYYKKNKKSFHTDYYNNTYRSGGIYIFPVISPRSYRSSSRSGYRSSYRSSSRSYRSSSRSYRSSSSTSSRSSSRSGYRSGKN